jgi:hypothetical protein
MAEIDLDELERIEKAATAAPWAVNHRSCEYLTTGDDRVLFGDLLDCLEADGNLIVVARNALPVLIARIRAQDALLREARGILNKLMKHELGGDKGVSWHSPSECSRCLLLAKLDEALKP